MLRIDRRMMANIEWPLLLLTLLLVGFGLLTILSATFQEGRALSPYVIRQAIWAALVAGGDELGAAHGDGPSADAALGPARGGKAGKSPADRGKNGGMKGLLTDEQGGPPGVVVAAADVNDPLLLGATVAAIVVERPGPTAERPQPLRLGGGYNNAPSREGAARRGCTAHVRPGGEEQKSSRPARAKRPRRRGVERALAWRSKCRAILVRSDKRAGNHLGSSQRACGLLWYRRLHQLQAA